MSGEQLLAEFIILLALGFDFVNGFHDTANAVATVIHSGTMKPRVAVVMSGAFNLLGAVCIGTAVAMVITKIVVASAVSLLLVLAVLLGAITWNLLTWYFALPVSSTHCLIGALFGAGVAAQGATGVTWPELSTVLLYLVISPVVGLVTSVLLTKAATAAEARLSDSPRKGMVLRGSQIFAAMAVSFSHGANDGQKTMGIITLVLASQFARYGYTKDHVELWVKVSAACAIGLGTCVGGWRIIATVGQKIDKNGCLTVAQGFGAQVSTAFVAILATKLGKPVSTTHTLTSAVLGGTLATGGVKQANWVTLRNIALGWILTLPAAAGLSMLAYELLFQTWGKF